MYNQYGKRLRLYVKTPFISINDHEDETRNVSCNTTGPDMVRKFMITTLLNAFAPKSHRNCRISEIQSESLIIQAVIVVASIRLHRLEENPQRIAVLTITDGMIENYKGIRS